MQGKLCSTCYRDVKRFEMTGGHYQVRTIGPSRKGKRPRPSIPAVKQPGPPAPPCKQQRIAAKAFLPESDNTTTASASAPFLPNNPFPQPQNNHFPIPAIVLDRTTFYGKRLLCSNVCNTLTDFLDNTGASTYVHIDVNVLWALLQQIQKIQPCPTPNCPGVLQICGARMEGLCLLWNWHCYRCTHVQYLSTCPVRTRAKDGMPLGPYHINYMSTLACLQTGLSYYKLNTFFNILAAESSFYQYQSALRPEITALWNQECRVYLRAVLDYVRSLGETTLECSFDCAWGTRGFKSTHGVARLMPSRRHTPPSMTSIPVIWNGVLSKPRSRAAHPPRSRQPSMSTSSVNASAIVPHTARSSRVALNDGTHTQSSKSMETALLIQSLQEIQDFLSKNNYPDIKLDVRVDGSAGVIQILTNHPLVRHVYRDHAHVAKSIHKHIMKKVPKSHTIDMKKQIISSVKKWFNIVLYVALKESWTEKQSRDTFLSYTRHKTNDHQFCLPTSRCKGPDYKPGALAEYFIEQDEKFTSGLMDALVTIWPDNPNFHLVTQLSTSHNESMNQSASRLHPKHTDFPASFTARDELAVITNTRGRRNSVETISKDCMGVSLRSSHLQLLDRLDQSKLKDQGHYQTRRKRKLLSMQQDASALSVSQPSIAPPSRAKSKKRKQSPSSSRKPKLQKTTTSITTTTAKLNFKLDYKSDHEYDDDMEHKYSVPDKLSPSIPAPELAVTNNSKHSKPVVYLCSKCHAPKKGHRCIVNTIK